MLAVAHIRGASTESKLKGIVYFKDVPQGTEVYVEVNGLPDYKPAEGNNPPIGPHGFHIHGIGNCEVGDVSKPFTSSGEHWNPGNQPHGNHAGDFPVLFSNNGYARMSFFTNKFIVKDVIGKSVIIHENPDDYRTQPAGASGKRIGCGVIKSFFQRKQANSYIRILHASPDAPAVDIYANDNLLVKNLAYKEFSQYLPVESGNYNIKVYPTGQNTNPVINTNLFIPENTVFNIAAVGTLPDINLYTIPEPLTGQKFDRACIRFINLSPNSPAFDVRFANGTKAFTNVAYKYITDYACIPSGTYSFFISPVNTSNTVLTVPKVNLSPNNYYTIYTFGQVGKTPGLEAIAVLEPR